MVEVDFDRLLERCDELVEYEDVLPLLVRACIMTEWTRNLNKKGLYLDVIKKCVESNPRTYDDAVNELRDWCDMNEIYKDFLLYD